MRKGALLMMLQTIESNLNQMGEKIDTLYCRLAKIYKRNGIPLPIELEQALMTGTVDPLTDFVNPSEQNSTKLNKR